MTPQQFVEIWKRAELKERSAVQTHFNDVCALLGQTPPAEADPSGTWFTFEAGADKTSGGKGFADVWKRNFFAWEYKGKHGDLDKAYQQLLQYRESLNNPPLLVVSDIDRIVIHTNFTNTVKRVIALTLDDLLTPQGRAQLREVFENPKAFQAAQTTEQVTQHAASEFGRIAQRLRQYGLDPQHTAHFLIRILFCLFAEDVGLLPNKIFSTLVRQTRSRAGELTGLLQELFSKMATGGWFGVERIRHFNGGLFDDNTAYDLDSESLDILARVSELDWSAIEPSIFGTLFERSLDPAKRSQIGAHYTSKDDILLIVEPVLMQPLRRKWAEVEREARALAAERDALRGPGAAVKAKRTRLDKQLQTLLMGFRAEVARVRVLDPAAGSGNFLYVALRLLLDLEKQVMTLMGELKLTPAFPTVHPAQLYAIEINPYAFELAQTTIWIGYIQWFHENGYGFPPEPILKPLHNFKNMDAILDLRGFGNLEGLKPREPEWEKTDVIVGNPPFLGGKRLRAELGDVYVDSLFKLYEGRVPHECDLVCYWFEKSRAMVEGGDIKRAGLLASQGIRGGANRKVLERIKKSGDIFMAWSDRPWILDGAAVRVSMVGFDRGKEQERALDGSPVGEINSNLTTAVNLTNALRLAENTNIAFMGDTKGGAFDIDEHTANKMRAAKGNPNRRPNSDVIRPWVNGLDVTRRPRNMFIIDFGLEMPEREAAQYELPFEHVKRQVKPLRMQNKRATYRENWWIHVEPRTALRAALLKLRRYIGTANVSKYRLFVWLEPPTLPDHQLIVFARDDDYFFGVLHSRVHELWALRMGTALTDRPRYTPTTTFETFPFPFPPGTEAQDDPRVVAIADAARELVRLRDNWLNPPDLSGAELKKRTLTNLYNENYQWLQNAHRTLDRAVFAAYGWRGDLPDEEILEKLLALNLERA